MNAQDKCESTLQGIRCGLKMGHSGKHRLGGSMWTDGGAARVAREEQEAKQKFVQQ